MNAVMDNIAEVFKINSDKKNVEFTKKENGENYGDVVVGDAAVGITDGDAVINADGTLASCH